MAGERVTMSATVVKNEFGKVLDQVIAGSVVVVTKHDTPKAVLLPIAAYDGLVSSQSSNLDALARKFDRMFARMQTPRSRRGMIAAFDASEKKLSQAAVTSARRRARK